MKRGVSVPWPCVLSSGSAIRLIHETLQEYLALSCEQKMWDMIKTVSVSSEICVPPGHRLNFPTIP